MEVKSSPLATPFGLWPTLVDLLRWRAGQQPDQEAYTFLKDGETEAVHLTYQELDQQARAIGAQLQALRAQGERAVLLYPPGLEYIAAFFGCLYSGTVAVPAYPPRVNHSLHRLETILTDSQARFVLTLSSLGAQLAKRLASASAATAFEVLATDTVQPESAYSWQAPAIGQDTLAFLQYTSGSTGTPRGVMVSHGNLLHNEHLIQDGLQQSSCSRIVGWLPLYHDMGLIGNVLQPLYVGAPCTLMSPIAFLERPLRWLQAISAMKATTSGGPNFAYDLCVRKIPPAQRQTLDLSSWVAAFNGAEPIRHDTIERFTEAFAPYGFRREAFAPCYGLAEATLIVSGSGQPDPPMVRTFQGAALAQHQVKVIETPMAHPSAQPLVGSGPVLGDQNLVIVHPASTTPCLPGQIGEIWISGASVSQGYWNRPEETEQTFRAHLANRGGGPFLRTGDMGFVHDGELFIMGRLKDLIIIRGRNHYPQDIEHTVEKCHAALRPGYSAAFSVDVAGEERVVIVQEVNHRQRLAPEALIVDICQAVSEQHECQVYAVVLIKAGSIPKTSSGKIQRHACRDQYLAHSLRVVHEWCRPDAIAPDHAPPNLAEAAVIAQGEARATLPGLETWLRTHLAQRLGQHPDAIDRCQPITQYGLDSLAAVELTHGIEMRLGVTLPMTYLLQGPTLAQVATGLFYQLAPAMSEQTAAAPEEPPRLRPVAHHGRPPLSFAQERLWFLQQWAPGTSAYHISAAVRLRGSLHVAALVYALGHVIRRHGILRTAFPVVQGAPEPVIEPVQPMTVHLADLSSLPGTACEEALQNLAAMEAQRPFDLARGPLLRVTLLRQDAATHVMLFTMHHIISDGWSMNILVQELSAGYRAFATGVPPVLPELPVQYADYAVWQRQCLHGEYWATQLAYWKQKLADVPPSLKLPTDRPRPSVQTFRGACRMSTLPLALAEPLDALCRDHGVTRFMLLLTALQVVLYKWSGQADIVVGTVSANRNRREIAPLMGCFMNFLPLRTQLSDDETALQLLERVKTAALEAYANQDYPFEQLVAALQCGRQQNQNPLYNVAFLLQDTPQLPSFSATLDVALLPVERQTALLDLRLIATPSPQGLSLEYEYNTDLFDAGTIDHVMAAYQQILEQIVANPNTDLAHVTLPDALKTAAQTAPTEASPTTLAITATFTAEPLEDALRFWMQELDMLAHIAFAPYHQVFQQLLDPASLLSTNTDGLNIILLRLEDWAHHHTHHGTSRTPDTRLDTAAMIARNVQDFIAAVEAAAERAPVPHLICLCPASPAAQQAAFLQQMETQIATELNRINGVYVVTTAELSAAYPVPAPHNPYGDQLGHVPYTDAFFAALGTMITRKIYAMTHAPYKVIVLDCDGTLWQGVCGEDGVEGIVVDASRQALQAFMISQLEAGMLLCLCSKNNEEDVFDVFERHPEMRLQRDHLVAWRVNWRPKSDNIAALAEELQLGLDSFIFIDDNPVECAEVEANCPDVLTLQLPQEAEEIADFLQHNWAFDHLKLTDEDRHRTKLYQQNTQRERVREKAVSLDAFLAELELEVEMTGMAPSQLPRVAQLTQRTNQFNCTALVRSESDIRQLHQSDTWTCLAVEVCDRFGDYGLVGVVIFEETAEALHVDTFLLSCRAMGRRVEHQMLAELGRIAQQQGLGYVEVLCIETAKNQPARDFLEQVGAPFRAGQAKGWCYRFPAEAAMALAGPLRAMTSSPSGDVV